MSLDPAIQKTIEEDPWFQNLPEGLRQALLDMVQVRRYAERKVLYSRGDTPDGIYVLVDGVINIYASSEPGNEFLLTMLGPPTWVGEIGLFDRLPRSHAVELAAGGMVLYLPLDGLCRMLEEHPSRWHPMALLLTHKLRLTFFALESYASVSTEVRLARHLIRLVEGLGTQAPRYEIRLHQQQLAQMIGLSRQTVNPALRKMSQSGLLKQAYGCITIVDMDELRRMAGYANWLPTRPSAKVRP